MSFGVKERGFYSNTEGIFNRLGVDNEEFNSKMMELAFTSPSSYYRLRRNVYTNIIKDSIGAIYQRVFFALTRGAVQDGNPANYGGSIALHNAQAGTLNEYDPDDKAKAILTQAGKKTSFVPGIPDEEADKIAMNFANTIKQEFDSQILNKILPLNQFNKTLELGAKKTAVENLA